MKTNNDDQICYKEKMTEECEGCEHYFDCKELFDEHNE